MPAIIKANATMLAGNPQLTNYNVSTASDGGLSINAEFVVLAQFAANAYSLFKIGSDIHSALVGKHDIISALQNYNSPKLPTLTSVDIVTTGGICTISVSYSGESMSTAGTNADGSEKVTSEITTTTDVRSLSGSLVFNAGTDTPLNVSFSFDYYATSVTTEGAAQARSIRPSEPFNVRSGDISPLAYVTTSEVYSTRTYRNNLGQYKVTQTVTGIYIQSKFLG